jgi:diguanylate cyclase (GGDEF)-like protein/PAS domain S-box-containing protein
MNAAGSTLEARRLAAIQRYQILDTPPDVAFDRVTAIAARLFQVPIALITIVDRDRIWFKSAHGLEITQIDREPGLCASAILHQDVYTITNALEDPRTRTNSLVRGAFGLRFYAAAPLITPDGFTLGTLCIIDRQPRPMAAEECQTLADLAAIVMDEMERRLSARQLMATTEAQSFRNAFDYAGIGMALVSPEGRWLEVNQALCELTGYTATELLATDFQSITHPDDLNVDLDLTQQILEGTLQHYHIEKRYRHQQGHWIWAMLSVSLVRDAHQKPLYFVAQIQDIDDRKRAELDLQKSQAMLLEAQRIGHIGSWDYDVQTGKISWSAEKFRILGRDPQLGEPSFEELLQRYHPDDGETLRQVVNRSLTQGEPYAVRLKCTRQDGSVGYIEERGQVVQDATGQVVRLFGITQDITERVQAEAELQEISTALAHTVEGISRLDRNGHYTLVNQAYAAIAGYTPEELMGQPWSITVHPEDLAAVVKAYETMLVEGSVRVKARGVRKDGSIFHKQLVMVTAYDEQHCPGGHFCFMKDITDQVELEVERQRADQALQQELQRLSQVIVTQQAVALGNPDRDRIIAMVTQQAQALTQADGAAVELIDGDQLVCHHGCGLAESQVGDRLPLVDSLSGRCLVEGKALYCSDVTRDERVNKSQVNAIPQGAIAVVPLTYQTVWVGVLKVFSTQPETFTESDQQTLQLLAGLLAASLHLATEFATNTSLLRALKDSEERYRSVVSALSEGVGMVQADGTISACNASAEEILGLRAEQIVGRSLGQLGRRVVQEDGSPYPRHTFPIAVTLRTGTPITHAIVGLLKPGDDNLTWLSLNTRPLFRQNETTPYATVVSFTDITELRRSEVAALRRQAERERLLSDIAQRIRQTLHLDDILATTVTEVQTFLATDRVMIYRLEPDGSGVIIAEVVTAGQPPLLGQKIPMAIAREHQTLFQAGHISACSQPPDGADVICPLDNLIASQSRVIVPIVQGQRLWGMLLAFHQDARVWDASELDVLQRLATQLAIAIQQSQLYQRLQVMNRQLEHLATHDGLTQVANRRSFDAHLAQEWHRLLRTQAPLSLILADIDYFKLYNDTYGHPAGDVCLQQVAAALGRLVKRPADLVARYGGEEFALILPTTDEEGAIAIAVAVQQSLEHLALFHGASPLGSYITMSLGIATLVPHPDWSPQTLIDAADTALYAAKHQGRNCYYLYRLKADKT